MPSVTKYSKIISPVISCDLVRLFVFIKCKGGIYLEKNKEAQKCRNKSLENFHHATFLRNQKSVIATMKDDAI